MDLKKIALTCAVTATGLTAGLFFGYQVSVIPAFKTLSDREYIAGMQAINVAIQNPAFGVAFMGPLVFLPLAAFLHRDLRISPRFKFLVLASVLYIIGSLGITFGANVPLNDKLVQFSLHTAQPA